MDKAIEDLIGEIEKNNVQIGKLLDNNVKLARKLKERPDEDWDWVSVATASRVWDISQPAVYQKITRGQLKCRKFGGKVYVSLSELKAIND